MRNGDGGSQSRWASEFLARGSVFSVGHVARCGCAHGALLPASAFASFFTLHQVLEHVRAQEARRDLIYGTSHRIDVEERKACHSGFTRRRAAAGSHLCVFSPLRNSGLAFREYGVARVEVRSKVDFEIHNRMNKDMKSRSVRDMGTRHGEAATQGLTEGLGF